MRRVSLARTSEREEEEEEEEGTDVGLLLAEAELGGDFVACALDEVVCEEFVDDGVLVRGAVVVSFAQAVDVGRVEEGRVEGEGRVGDLLALGRGLGGGRASHGSGCRAGWREEPEGGGRDDELMRICRPLASLHPVPRSTCSS